MKRSFARNWVRSFTSGSQGSVGVTSGTLTIDATSRQIAIFTTQDLVLSIGSGTVFYPDTTIETEILPIPAGTTSIAWTSTAPASVSLESESATPVGYNAGSRVAVQGGASPYLYGDLDSALSTDGFCIGVLFKTSVLETSPSNQNLLTLGNPANMSKEYANMYVSSGGDNIFHSGWDSATSAWAEGVFTNGSGAGPFLISTDSWNLFSETRIAGSATVRKHLAGVLEADRVRTTGAASVPTGLSRVHMGRYTILTTQLTWTANQQVGLAFILDAGERASGTVAAWNTAVQAALTIMSNQPFDDAGKVFDGLGLVACWEFHGDGIWTDSVRGVELLSISTAAEAADAGLPDPVGTDPFAPVTAPTYTTDHYLAPQASPPTWAAATDTALPAHNGYLRIVGDIGTTVTLKDAGAVALPTFVLDADANVYRIPLAASTFNPDALVTEVTAVASVKQPALRYVFSTTMSDSGHTGPNVVTTRTGATATRVNSAGTMVTVAADTTRYTYDPVTLAPLGLLHEPARANSIAQPLDMANAAWGKTACTVDSDAANGPEKTANIDRINVTASANYHGIFDQMTRASGLYGAYSVFVRDDGAGYVCLSYASGTQHFASMLVDLTTGLVVDDQVGTNSGTIYARDVEDWGGGLYRITLACTISVANGFLFICACDTATPTYTDAGVPTYTAVEGEDIFVGYVQSEDGEFATTFVNGTRNAEVSTVTLTNQFAAEGTLVAEGSRARPKGAATSQYLASLSNGTTAQQATVYSYLNGSAAGYIANSTAQYSDVAFGLFQPDVRHRIALTIAANDFQPSFDGVLGTQDVSGSIPTGVNKLTIGASPVNTNDWSGCVQEIKYFNRRLSDTELAAETMGITYSGLVVGDSFSDAAGEWPTVTNYTVHSTAVAGATLASGIASQLTAALAAAPPTATYVVMGTGVNDVLTGQTLPQMQASLTSLVNATLTAGLSPVVMGIGPFASYSGWTSGFQAIADNYNAWLAANEVALGYTYVNIYDALEGAADTIAVRYDSGDGLHPSINGSYEIARLVDIAIGTL